MRNQETDVEAQKAAAAGRALELVQSGMVLGLGTGSTARYFIEGVGRLIRKGAVIRAVATSLDSRGRAEACGIPLLDEIHDVIDLTVDGADEIDPDLNCVKGRGGALLREKIVAHASRRFVLIADEGKLVTRLGRGPVPVEVVAFLWERTSHYIAELGGRPTLRVTDGAPFRTDNGNVILDVIFEEIGEQLAPDLGAIPGVVEHGLFLRMAHAAIIAGRAGVSVLGELA
jgi:ribose 5-phosphate isomerase A